jgi:hypothetical protein
MSMLLTDLSELCAAAVADQLDKLGAPISNVKVLSVLETREAGMQRVLVDVEGLSLRAMITHTNGTCKVTELTDGDKNEIRTFADLARAFRGVSTSDTL